MVLPGGASRTLSGYGGRMRGEPEAAAVKLTMLVDLALLWVFGASQTSPPFSPL